MSERDNAVAPEVAKRVFVKARELIDSPRSRKTRLLDALEQLGYAATFQDIIALKKGLKGKTGSLGSRISELNQILYKACHALAVDKIMITTEGGATDDPARMDFWLKYVPLSTSELDINNAPQLRVDVVGREAAVDATLSGVANIDAGPMVVHGWPGVGKTTLVKTVAHAADVAKFFPDGVLWASIGPNGDCVSAVNTWGQLLGEQFLTLKQDLAGAQQRLTELLRDQRMLLIVDDVWDAAHFAPLDAAGSQCGVLITTRSRAVALEVTRSPERACRLEVLNDDQALTLLRNICPDVIDEYEEACRSLIVKIDRLPLALHVIGRMLRREQLDGLDVAVRIDDLTENVEAVLGENVPSDMVTLSDEITPSVRAVLRRSIDQLGQVDMERFAMLGTFAAEPATFDLGAVEAVWDTTEPRDTLRRLIDRGLIEPLGQQRFQMHPILIHLARSLQ